MAWKKQFWQSIVGCSGGYGMSTYSKPYSSRPDLRELRPMILKTIENRAKEYPLRPLVPVAREVLKSRSLLIQGVSILIQVIPVLTCKSCPEVYVGERGHLIQTCSAYKRRSRNRVHEWVPGTVKDVIVPVETLHLKEMFREVIRHDQRFVFDRVPAVVELCWQAGADPSDDDVHVDLCDSPGVDGAKSLSQEELTVVANGTLNAWERLRLGVQKLLRAYPVKVCKHCSEVHVGPSGHEAQLCGLFKNETLRGSHFWKRAWVDDLVPQQIVWRRRPQDPPVLVNEGKGFYGHAPAVVELCRRAGAKVPKKYSIMMKDYGLPLSAELEP